MQRMDVIGLCAGLGLTVMTAGPAAAQVSLDDLTYLGTGQQRAGVAIDWNNAGTPTTYTFGYRYDGSAPTVEQMLRDVAGTGPDDAEVYLRVGTSGLFGVPLYGLGLDVDQDGFALSDGTTFVDGVAETGSSDGALASDFDDQYIEGWNTGFWSLYTGHSSDGWTAAATGISGVSLTDEAWVGLSFAPAFVQSEPSVAIPEPATVAGMAPLGLALLRRRRRTDTRAKARG
jgi:hypothetical protein